MQLCFEIVECVSLEERMYGDVLPSGSRPLPRADKVIGERLDVCICDEHCLRQPNGKGEAPYAQREARGTENPLATCDVHVAKSWGRYPLDVVYVHRT